MVKTVVLVPRSEMLFHAQKISEQYKLDILYIKAINTNNAEKEAINAAEAGAEIIIARGTQATIIKESVAIPVVEICLTGQEMGRLIKKAKSIINTPNPTIGVVGFSNMFCDMSSFNALYDITLKEYFVENAEETIHAVRTANIEGVDAVIGGDLVCEYANEHNMLGIFQVSGEESIAEAFRMAENVGYAIGVEKKNTAEFRALLDYSFNGIIKIDDEGKIERVNHFIENLFGLTEQELIGNIISDLAPSIDKEMLEQVLLHGKEIYFKAFMIKNNAVVANIVPILLDEEAHGGIISFHESIRVEKMEAEIRRELYQKGYVAQFRFSDFVKVSPRYKEILKKAESYASFTAPVLIIGEEGTEGELIAESIHNAGIGDSPFVTFCCESAKDRDFQQILFGDIESGSKGLVDWAMGGTLYIEKISRLSLSAQSHLYQFIRKNAYIRTRDAGVNYNQVRIIAFDVPELIDKMNQGEFRRDLFHGINVLPLYIAPIRERREDISGWVDKFLANMEKGSQRYLKLTSEAYSALTGYSWDGNMEELYYMCERLITLAPSRNVTASTINAVIAEIYPSTSEITLSGNNKSALLNPEEAKLHEALEKHHGKRQRVAEELGISTTTLWRRMKKYNID